MFWQLGSQGSLQLFLRKPGETTPVNFSTGPVIGRERWGAWYTLACVVDSQRKTVSHYFEGKNVAQLPFADPFDIRIEEATLGNSLMKENKKTDRSLDGRIDQFMLFERALSDVEVRRLHHSVSSFILEEEP